MAGLTHELIGTDYLIDWIIDSDDVWTREMSPFGGALNGVHVVGYTEQWRVCMFFHSAPSASFFNELETFHQATQEVSWSILSDWASREIDSQNAYQWRHGLLRDIAIARRIVYFTFHCHLNHVIGGPLALYVWRPPSGPLVTL